MCMEIGPVDTMENVNLEIAQFYSLWSDWVFVNAVQTRPHTHCTTLLSPPTSLLENCWVGGATWMMDGCFVFKCSTERQLWADRKDSRGLYRINWVHYEAAIAWPSSISFREIWQQHICNSFVVSEKQCVRWVLPTGRKWGRPDFFPIGICHRISSLDSGSNELAHLLKDPGVLPGWLSLPHHTTLCFQLSWGAAWSFPSVHIFPLSLSFNS